MTECVNHIRATAAKKRQQSKDLVIIVRQTGGAVCGNFQSRVHVTTIVFMHLQILRLREN